MRTPARWPMALVAAAAMASPAFSAEVVIAINKSTQRMSVSVDGQERYSWPVSTGMAGYATPVGTFTPSRLVRQHYSKEWDNAPMPHSIFFTDAGHAIHGSYATGRLGTPASHGCVRLAPTNASTLYKLVQAEGLANARIELTGADPASMRVGRGTATGDYSHITSFDPLATGIMAGGSSTPHRSERSKRP